MNLIEFDNQTLTFCGKPVENLWKILSKRGKLGRSLSILWKSLVFFPHVFHNKSLLNPRIYQDFNKFSTISTAFCEKVNTQSPAQIRFAGQLDYFIERVLRLPSSQTQY